MGEEFCEELKKKWGERIKICIEEYLQEIRRLFHVGYISSGISSKQIQSYHHPLHLKNPMEAM